MSLNFKKRPISASGKQTLSANPKKPVFGIGKAKLPPVVTDAYIQQQADKILKKAEETKKWQDTQGIWNEFESPKSQLANVENEVIINNRKGKNIISSSQPKKAKTQMEIAEELSNQYDLNLSKRTKNLKSATSSNVSQSSSFGTFKQPLSKGKSVGNVALQQQLPPQNQFQIPDPYNRVPMTQEEIAMTSTPTPYNPKSFFSSPAPPSKNEKDFLISSKTALSNAELDALAAAKGTPKPFPGPPKIEPPIPSYQSSAYLAPSQYPSVSGPPAFHSAPSQSGYGATSVGNKYPEFVPYHHDPNGDPWYFKKTVFHKNAMQHYKDGNYGEAASMVAKNIFNRPGTSTEIAIDIDEAAPLVAEGAAAAGAGGVERLGAEAVLGGVTGAIAGGSLEDVAMGVAAPILMANPEIILPAIAVAAAKEGHDQYKVNRDKNAVAEASKLQQKHDIFASMEEARIAQEKIDMEEEAKRAQNEVIYDEENRNRQASLQQAQLEQFTRTNRPKNKEKMEKLKLKNKSTALVPTDPSDQQWTPKGMNLYQVIQAKADSEGKTYGEAMYDFKQKSKTQGSWNSVFEAAEQESFQIYNHKMNTQNRQGAVKPPLAKPVTPTPTPQQPLAKKPTTIYEPQHHYTAPDEKPAYIFQGGKRKQHPDMQKPKPSSNAKPVVPSSDMPVMEGTGFNGLHPISGDGHLLSDNSSKNLVNQTSASSSPTPPPGLGASALKAEAAAPPAAATAAAPAASYHSAVLPSTVHVPDAPLTPFSSPEGMTMASSFTQGPSGSMGSMSIQQQNQNPGNMVNPESAEVDSRIITDEAKSDAKLKIVGQMKNSKKYGQKTKNEKISLQEGETKNHWRFNGPYDSPAQDINPKYLQLENMTLRNEGELLHHGKMDAHKSLWKRTHGVDGKPLMRQAYYKYNHSRNTWKKLKKAEKERWMSKRSEAIKAGRELPAEKEAYKNRHLAAVLTQKRKRAEQSEQMISQAMAKKQKKSVDGVHTQL